jgi:hypothetical protein
MKYFIGIFKVYLPFIKNKSYLPCLLLFILLLYIAVICFISLTDPFTYCQGENLEELKATLYLEITRYFECLSQYEDIHDKVIVEEEFLGKNPDVYGDNHLNDLMEEAEEKCAELQIFLADIRYTEECIKEIEPNFQSNLEKQGDFENDDPN